MNQIVELTKKNIFWRYDGDPTAFDISDSNLRLLVKYNWVNSDDETDIYQEQDGYTIFTDSVANYNLVAEFQSIQSKINSLVPQPIDDGNPLPEGFTRQTRIWRYQGEIVNGDITQTTLELWLHSVLVDTNGIIYNPQWLPTVSGNIVDWDLLGEFQSIQSKISSLLNADPETKTIELEPSKKVWRYQAIEVIDGDITTAIAQYFVKGGLRDISTGELYKEQVYPAIQGTPQELGLLTEYQGLQTKIENILETWGD